jgi:hypothetical protein
MRSEKSLASLKKLGRHNADCAEDDASIAPTLFGLKRRTAIEEAIPIVEKR